MVLPNQKGLLVFYRFFPRQVIAFNSKDPLLNRQSGVWGIADISYRTENLLYLGNGRLLTCGLSYLIFNPFSNILRGKT